MIFCQPFASLSYFSYCSPVHFPPPLKFCEDGDFCFWYLKDCSVYNKCPTDVWWSEQIDEYYLFLAVAFLCPHVFSCSLCIHKARAASLVFRGFPGFTGAGSSPCSLTCTSFLALALPGCVLTLGVSISDTCSEHGNSRDHILWTFELERFPQAATFMPFHPSDE